MGAAQSSSGGGGATCLCEDCLGLSSLPPPIARPWGKRPGLAARFPSARGMRAWGPVTNPTAHTLASWLCALWWQPKGSLWGRPVPLRGVSGIGHSPRPSCPSLGQAARACCPFSLGAGGGGVGTHHQPHSARSCELALWAVVAAQGLPVRAALCLREGCPGLGTLPPPAVQPWGRRPGPAARFLWARGEEARGPVTNPTAHALASWLCALWWRHKDVSWGAPCTFVWSVRGRELSLPKPPVLGVGGRGPLPVCRGRGGCGRGDRSPTRQRTLLPAPLCAVAAAQWRPVGAPCASVKDVRRRALPLPLPPVLGAGGRGPLPVCRGRRGCGHGDPSSTPQRTLL